MDTKLCKNAEDKLLLSKIIDKMELSKKRNSIETSDFLDLAQQGFVENYLKAQKIESVKWISGNDTINERKILVSFPEKRKEIVEKMDILKVIRINLPKEMIGKYSHRDYLGAFMKLGVRREKIGDILVEKQGADCIIKPEIASFLIENLGELTRFQKANIEGIPLEQIRKVEQKVEIMKITIASMRLDALLAELLHVSRSEANKIIAQERVFINFKLETKSSKDMKESDIITIRGKGRFHIKEELGDSKKGRKILQIEKYV